MIIGDRKTTPPQKGVEINVVGHMNTATPQNGVPSGQFKGRLKGRARKEARLHKRCSANACVAYTKPAEDEKKASASGRAKIETQGREAKRGNPILASMLADIL